MIVLIINYYSQYISRYV